MDVADAWLRSSTVFLAGPGTSTRLAVTAFDLRDRSLLADAWKRITDLMELHAGYCDAWASTTLSVSLEADPQWQASRKKELRDLIRRSRQNATPGQQTAADLLDEALASGRVVRAGSDRCRSYDMLAIPDADSDYLALVQGAIRTVSRMAFDARDPEDWNNLSPAVRDVTTATLGEALAAHAPVPVGAVPIVGVIVPGGPAAPGDVLEKLAGQPVDVRPSVVPRSAPDLDQQMLRAVDYLRMQSVVALIIGYGGGEQATLERVRLAVERAVSGIDLPVYVGIGHNDFDSPVAGASVRTCTTPADAATLFIAEALKASRQRAAALNACARELALAGADADRASRALAKLQAKLSQIDAELDEERRVHAQRPR